jgi:GSH-dependent disulfide-bond oxidoreductase
MIDLYYWPTPNGHKITLFLEETGLDYTIHPINIGKGDQFDPAFLKIAPNNRMPAIVDHAPKGGGEPISVFESGAILLYLAEKTGKFIPKQLRGRVEVLQWLFWQMGGLGPMAGQNHHFVQYAPEKLPYAIDRYVNETNRLYGVLNKRLADRAFVAGASYTIADMASIPGRWATSGSSRSWRTSRISSAGIARSRPAPRRSAPTSSDPSTAAPPPWTRMPRRSCSARPPGSSDDP